MTQNRNIGLDYLRAIAILIVIFNHGLLGFYIDTSRIKFEGFIASISASTVISIEWLFVLSGFLIGTMMIRSFESERGWLKSARDFWLRRWFRTIPNYYLFVLVNLILVTTGFTSGVFEYKYLFFSQNLAWIETSPHFFGESWSLALDEWFYLLMPMILGLLNFKIKTQKNRFIFTSTILIICPTLARFFHEVTTEFFQWDSEIRRITIYHLDATGWGVLAACANKWYPLWWKSNIQLKAILGMSCMVLGVLLVVGMIHPSSMNHHAQFISHTFSITLMSGGTFLIIPWLTGLYFKQNSISWLVEKISLYSYSIYLVHFPLIFIFRRIFSPDKGTSELLVFLIATSWILTIFASSALIFKWFEKPTSDLREKFTKRVDASPFK